MRFNFRVDDLEVRSCDYPNRKIKVVAEIVKWQTEDTCYIVAYWDKFSEGYELTFVGDRPFNLGRAELFMRIAKVGQEILDEDFNQ